MRERVYFYCQRDSMEHYFHFEALDGSKRLDLSYALRFQVYCLERGLLPADEYPSGLESDDCDDRSLHFGAFYRDESLAGTVRLVRGALSDLPVTHRCSIDVSALPAGVTDANVAEISRLAVSKAFRRRITDGALPDEKESPADTAPAGSRRRPCCPELVLGLYKIMYHETKRRGIEYWFAAMEGSLAKLLNRFHFHFRPIGPEVDYYGPVRPYVASISELEQGVMANSADLFWGFMEGLEREHLPPIARN